jgi:hypothetical protein
MRMGFALECSNPKNGSKADADMIIVLETLFKYTLLNFFLYIKVRGWLYLKKLSALQP